MPEPASPSSRSNPDGSDAGGRVAVDGLRVAFGSQPVIDEVSFELAGGSSAAVIGPNGSGKTTLLNVLVGSVKPTAGTVSIDAPSGSIAYVLQHRDAGTWLPLTAREVITMGRYGRRGLLGRLTAADRRLIDDAATRLEVGDLLGRQYGELSGGQQQRVRLAQALTQEPAVLLLDEPITGLDLASQQRILDLIEEQTAEGVTVVLTTHNLDEARHCDTVLILAGRLVAAGAPDDVLVPARLREAFGDRVLGDHRHHSHADELLMIDDHGHGH